MSLIDKSGPRQTRETAPWPDFPRLPTNILLTQQGKKADEEIQQMWERFRVQLDRMDRRLSESEIKPGMIMVWRRPLAEIPAGWHLCDGEMGTVDLRRCFIKGATEDAEVGTAGGAALHTPAGTVAAPVFTGTETTTRAESGGTPSGAVAGATSNDTAGTPVGENDEPAFTGTEVTSGSTSGGTPSGTVGGTVGSGGAHTHSFTATGSVTSPDVVAPDTSGTGVAPAGTTDSDGSHGHSFSGSFAGDALAGHTHTVTAAGTVAAPIFTGEAMDPHDHTVTGLLSGNPLPPHGHHFTAVGSNTAPNFTGTEANFEPRHTLLYFIEKL